MFKNLNLAIRNIYEISRLLKIKNKKLKINYLIGLSNAVVLLDLLIIYLLTSFFQPVELPLFLGNYDIEDFRISLPIFVLLRFLVIYLDTMNIHRLRLNIEESLEETFLMKYLLGAIILFLIHIFSSILYVFMYRLFIKILQYC